jgi:hypothetical protein
MFTGPNIVKDGLVLHLDAGSHKSYPGSGTTWYDLSGNGNNGTLVNSPTFDSQNNGSFFFDQTNESVSTNRNGSELGISDSAISGELIIKKDDGYPTNNQQGHIGFGSVISIKNSIVGSGYFLDAYNISDGRLLTNFQGPTFTSIYEYTWMVLTFTIDNETVKTYTNGTPYQTKTLTGGLKSIQSVDFSMASGFGYYRTYGNISSVKLYNRALTPEEVLQNYNATKSRFNL